MTLLRSPLVLLAGLLIGGCSLLGIGSKNDDSNAPPTQVAFSLYAGQDVNPNPDSAPPAFSAPAPQASQPRAITVDPGAKEGPYLLNLRGNSKADLAGQMRVLLDHLQEDSKTDGVRTAPVALNPPLPLDGVGDTRRTTASEPTPALGQYAGRPASGLSQGSPPPARSAVATPVTFKILQLKDDSMFLNADYNLLAKDLKKALGSTYITDDDYVLQPGQFKYIDYATVDKKARYIAVLANFHKQNGAVWKQVLRLESRGYRYALQVIFRNSEVSIVDEGYRPPPPSKKS